ncbi:helix-turn-helix transcriptional regulator [Sinimarinibacterium flocculans]|uniref:helix-turn-helix transcriptional regulator n=1 Tax=Sinimarinibacterium flocculans TaxID=985250 RepID=UPI002EA5624A|nr:helix-turn-helix transcriptional regulator [Pseudomonadota bacterium]
MVRKRWALTQRELAALLGATTREHISRLENCRAHPSAALLLSLEVVFGKAPHTLFPEFYDEIEDRVVRNLYRMQQELERGDADDVRQRTKHQLLAEALSRAVLRTKRPTDYDL